MASTNGHQSWDRERIAAIVERSKDVPGALLPVLHAIQDEVGYIDDRAVPVIAEGLNISRAEVVGVIHFYHDFRTEKSGRHLLKICRAEACQSMGCEEVVDHVCSQLRVGMGGTTADGALTVESVYCLGNCALSPAAMLDGKLFGRVTPARADQILAGVSA